MMAPKIIKYLGKNLTRMERVVKLKLGYIAERKNT